MSVLLPLPGSPPTRMIEPATTPPPSTRSSSASPVLARFAAATSTSASGRGPRDAPALPSGAQRARDDFAAAPALGFAAGASAAVFHAPHEGQRPNQRGSSLPHAEQKKWGFAVLGTITLRGGGGSEDLDLEVLLRVGLDVRDQRLDVLGRRAHVVVELVVVHQFAEGALTAVDLADHALERRAQRVQPPREVIHLLRGRSEVLERLLEVRFAIGGQVFRGLRGGREVLD